MDTSALLKKHGLKLTQPRRIVLETLVINKRPMTPQDIAQALDKRERGLNIATVYRVLDSLETAHLVHRYPCSGEYAACQLPDKHGHHVLAHCHACGDTAEFLEPKLCKIESTLARKANLSFATHFSEICGICTRCSTTR